MALSRYVLDTSAYSYFKRGDSQAVDLIDGAVWIGMPAVVLGELEVGFLLGMPKLLDTNRAVLQEFLDNSVVEQLGTDFEVSRIYAEIVVALRRAGRKLPTNDIWIAAIAGRNGASVLTYDRHFHVIPGVRSTILKVPDSKANPR